MRQQEKSEDALITSTRRELLFVINTNLAPAQVFDLDKDRLHIVELDGMWRFHTGDDPRWSDPNLDDSSWQLLQSNQPWTAQGFKGYSGLAWYRFKLKIPQVHKPLSLFVPIMTTSYELFAIGPELRKRQQGTPEPIKEIAWKAQIRLCKRYARMAAAGKNQKKIVTAVGRELRGFIWAIGTKAEAAAQQRSAA